MTRRDVPARPGGGDRDELDKVLRAGDGLDMLASRLEHIPDALPRRLNADPERAERGLAQLVLTLIELLRQLLEKQALRRVEGGSLSDEEVERLGVALMKLEERMEELKREFGLEDADLELRLGPLRDLM